MLNFARKRVHKSERVETIFYRQKAPTNLS